MELIQKITQAIEPSLTAMGYALVQVKLADGMRRKTLAIVAERADFTMMSFDDCTEISRTVSALLDVEDPITTAYDLEVSSPGIDRPLFKPADYQRFLGHELKLETHLPKSGQKRFKGTISKADDTRVIVTTEAGVAQEFSYRDIRSAKLLLTDALIEASNPEPKKQPKPKYQPKQKSQPNLKKRKSS